MIACLRTVVCKQPIIALYFEFETVAVRIKCLAHEHKTTNPQGSNLDPQLH